MYVFSLKELDNNLAKQRIVKENGKYSVIILPVSWSDKMSTGTVVSTHRTAYVRWTTGLYINTWFVKPFVILPGMVVTMFSCKFSST